MICWYANKSAVTISSIPKITLLRTNPIVFHENFSNCSRSGVNVLEAYKFDSLKIRKLTFFVKRFSLGGNFTKTTP